MWQRLAHRFWLGSAVLVLTLLATLCGAVLAFRYKAPILVPVIVCAVATALFAGFVVKADGWSIVFGIVAISVGLQFGFLSACSRAA